MFIRNKEGRVPVTVHLEDIAGKLEETMDHWEQYLNVVTGVFEALPDGMYIAVSYTHLDVYKRQLPYHKLTKLGSQTQFEPALQSAGNCSGIVLDITRKVR